MLAVTLARMDAVCLNSAGCKYLGTLPEQGQSSRGLGFFVTALKAEGEMGDRLAKSAEPDISHLVSELNLETGNDRAW